MGQDAIVGMNFIAKSGIRLYLSDGILCLPDEVRIQFSKRSTIYGNHNQALDVKMG